MVKEIFYLYLITVFFSLNSYFLRVISKLRFSQTKKYQKIIFLKNNISLEKGNSFFNKKDVIIKKERGGL